MTILAERLGKRLEHWKSIPVYLVLRNVKLAENPDLLKKPIYSELFVISFYQFIGVSANTTTRIVIYQFHTLLN